MRIEMLEVGRLTAAAALVRAGAAADETVTFPVPAFLIEAGGERILVDTGLDPRAVADPAGHYPEAAVAAAFGFEQRLSLAEQLDPASLSMVVLTHLHFDHAGGLSLLPPELPVVVQRTEWLAGQDRDSIARNFLCPRDYATVERELVLVDGDHDLLGDGSIELLLTPGHTPGHQSVRAGELVIGGDVVHFAAALDDHRFPAFADDHAAQAHSADRLRALRAAGCTVLPGHDPEVLRPGPLAATPAAADRW